MITFIDGCITAMAGILTVSAIYIMYVLMMWIKELILLLFKK